MRIFLACGLWLALLAPGWCQSPASSKIEALDYQTAYQRCLSSDKPMLVMVTATWCPPCQQMKNNTLPQLVQRGSFKDVHFAMVDLDQQPEIAQALIGDRGVPQLVLFQKSNNEWVRRYISGMQTVEGVEAFIGKSSAVQIATGGELGLPKK